MKNLTTNIKDNAVRNIILAKKKKKGAPSLTFVIKLFTIIVKVFPTAIDNMKKPIISDFILLGACVYENSKHVNMWRSFCEKKCTKFINFFPYFFEEKKRTSYLEVYKKYYFWNDVHFNAEGNRVIAEKLLKEF